MNPLIKEQSNQKVNKVTDNLILSITENNSNIQTSNTQKSISHNEDQKAYETILQKLQESNEEWWLVSSENEVKGYAYRQRLPFKK
jgi:hypothetical protein